MKNKDDLINIGLTILIVLVTVLGVIIYNRVNPPEGVILPAIAIEEDNSAIIMTPEIVYIPTPAPTSSPSLEHKIYQLTNQEREKNGCYPLRYSYELQKAATQRALECATSYSHTRPDGTTYEELISEIDWYVSGENLIMADEAITAHNMMDAWMKSEGHRANILLPEYTLMGVGSYTEAGIVYVVQLFIGQ